MTAPLSEATTDDAWRLEIESGLEALEKENHVIAEQHFRTALEWMRGEREADDPALSPAIEGLAKTSSIQRQFARSRAFYRRLIRIKEKQLGADHDDVKTVRTNLAMIRDARDRMLDGR